MSLLIYETEYSIKILIICAVSMNKLNDLQLLMTTLFADFLLIISILPKLNSHVKAKNSCELLYFALSLRGLSVIFADFFISKSQKTIIELCKILIVSLLTVHKKYRSLTNSLEIKIILVTHYISLLLIE